jgi:hypothetical protein
MNPAIKPTEPDMPNEVEELAFCIASTIGTKGDDDDRDDEQAYESEISVRGRAAGAKTV